MVNEATQSMTIEATSKENDYSKQCVNYLRSWNMRTTNKLLVLQTALRKRMHSSKQPELAVVSYHHIVGENGLGLNRPRHYYQIIQVLYHQ